MTAAYWLLGSLGFVAIEASYVPQLLRVFRRKHADDISLLFPGLNFAGRVAAFGYSLHLADVILIVGFVFGLMLRGALLFQVAYYRGRA